MPKYTRLYYFTVCVLCQTTVFYSSRGVMLCYVMLCYSAHSLGAFHGRLHQVYSLTFNLPATSEVKGERSDHCATETFPPKPPRAGWGILATNLVNQYVWLPYHKLQLSANAPAFIIFLRLMPEYSSH